MNESESTNKFCSLQNENQIDSIPKKNMEIYLVSRKYSYDVYDDYSYYGHYRKTDIENLGYFSTAENAFAFIKDRVINHYGNYDDYNISVIDIDTWNIQITNEEQDTLKRWEQWHPKVGDTNG